MVRLTGDTTESDTRRSVHGHAGTQHTYRERGTFFRSVWGPTVEQGPDKDDGFPSRSTIAKRSTTVPGEIPSVRSATRVRAAINGVIIDNLLCYPSVNRSEYDST